MENLYATRDLSLASYLSMHFEIEQVDKSNPKSVEFKFKRTPELQQAMDDFWDGKQLVEPKSYFQAIKLMKGRIYG